MTRFDTEPMGNYEEIKLKDDKFFTLTLARDFGRSWLKRVHNI